MSAVHVSEDFMPFVQKLERSSRQGWYMYMIQKTLQSNMNYELVRCFLDFPGEAYRERFTDNPGFDGFTTLPTSVFCWLINIHTGYLVFRKGKCLHN